LENLQPTGSFKVRGAGNSIALLTPEQRSHGVFTCSAGNMAQALAWHARRLGIPCTAIVPDTAPATKLAAIRRFGATIVQLSWDEVWEIGISRRYTPLKGWTFVHPFADATMMAGNGTIGLEILEDLPDADAVIIPFGGGGLSAGIATAIKAKRPRTRVYACEPETAAPLAASFAKSAPAEVHRLPSFVDGIGASSGLPASPSCMSSSLRSLEFVCSMSGVALEPRRNDSRSVARRWSSSSRIGEKSPRVEGFDRRFDSRRATRRRSHFRTPLSTESR